MKRTSMAHMDMLPATYEVTLLNLLRDRHPLKKPGSSTLEDANENARNESLCIYPVSSGVYDNDLNEFIAFLESKNYDISVFDHESPSYNHALHFRFKKNVYESCSCIDNQGVYGQVLKETISLMQDKLENADEEIVYILLGEDDEETNQFHNAVGIRFGATLSRVVDDVDKPTVGDAEYRLENHYALRVIESVYFVDVNRYYCMESEEIYEYMKDMGYMDEIPMLPASENNADKRTNAA